MTTREQAEARAADFNTQTRGLRTISYGVDQSPVTGAWRVIEHRDGYLPKVASS